MTRRKVLMAEDIDSFMGATPLPPGREVGPLSEFPAPHLEAIRQAVAHPRPPARYFTVNDGLAQLESRAWYEWHWARGIDPTKRRDKLSAWRRRSVIERDGFVCQLCGGDVDRDDVHIDHIVPASLGGGDELTNLQVTHSLCNVRKGARWLEAP